MQPDSQRPMSPTQYNFKTALTDFERLKQQNSLPYKMQIKLQYLQNKLLNRKLIPEQYKQLPEYQLQSLQQCDRPSQIQLFVSIVKCLSGKEVIVYFKNEKAYIKKEESFSLWNKCYLSCDSIFLYVKKKADKKTNYYQFKMSKLKVSKKYLSYKDKICFGLLYDNKRYMLGFEQVTACERIFMTVRQLVRENNPNKDYRADSPLKKNLNSPNKGNNLFALEKSEKFQSVMLQDKLPNSQSISSNQKQSFHSCQQPAQSIIGQKKQETQENKKINGNMQKGSSKFMQFQPDEVQKVQQMQRRKQEQVKEAIKDEVRKYGTFIQSDKDYKLISNFELGRVLLYESQNPIPSSSLSQSSVLTKTCLLLSLSSLSSGILLQHYLNLKSWNIQIQQSQIISKISDNSYKLFIQFKKYSFVSLARWVIVTVTAMELDKKTYLIVKQVQDLTEEQLKLGNYMTMVRVKKWEQILEVCSKKQQKEKDQKILLTILTISDFGGYCSKSDNLNMTLHVLPKNINNFYNYLLTQSISAQYEQNTNPLFVFQMQKSNESVTIEKSSSTSTINIKEMKNLQLSGIKSRQRKESCSQFSMDQMQESIDDKDKDRQYYFERKRNNKSQISQPEEEILPKTSFNKKSPRDQSNMFHDFIKQFKNYQQNNRGTQIMVAMITEQKLQEMYYLKHRFIQSSKVDPQALRYNNDPQNDNWLLQKGMWRVDGLELIFTNEEILAQQKNVIKLILKQLSSNVMAGKNIMSMSLPVEIFENKSFLQKLGQVYGLFPYYFNLAAKQKNIVKQITLVTQAFAFATTICPNIEKPFNPILGQTYQCTIGGVSLCFEQVSHHPPISAFYIKTDEYVCWGNHNPNVDMGLNSAVAKNINPMNVHFFQTDTKYSAYCQDFQIGGLMFGRRTYKNSGKVNVFEERNQILLQMSYGKAKKHVYQSPKKIKTGEIIGGVFRVSPSFTKRFKHMTWKHFDGLKYDEKIQELAKLNGNWLGDFYVDGVKVRGMWDVVPYKPVKEIVVLPSDCSFRMDVYYKKMGDNKKSQYWKEVMENAQRKDRKLREEYTGKKH